MIAVSRLRRRAVHRVAIPCIAVAAAAVAASALAQARPSPASFADLAEKVAPAVVNIATERKTAAGQRDRAFRFPLPEDTPFGEFFERFRREMPGFRSPEQAPPSGGGRALGSGFLVDPAGYVVTNHHVVAGADDVRVTLHDGESHRARLVGADPRTDLALLKIDAGRALPAVSFGDSSRIRAGDWVMAVGNPFGLGGTITAGIVSARGRDLPGGALVDFLQIDAPINRGNSGGPAFDADGKVIGVNTAIFSPTGGSVGIGFAIPSNLARPIVDQLSRFGRARRGWLGVRIQSVTDELARGLGLDKARGALVAGVTEDSPAQGGGVRVGDVILTFDAKPVDEMRRLPRLVAETDVGKRVSMEVWRDGATIDVEVEVGEFPDDEPAVVGARPAPDRPADDGVEVLGLALSRVTPELRERYEIGTEVDGVVVTRIEDDSPAADGRLRPGDVIRKVGPRQTRVTAPSEVKAQIDAAGDAGTTTVLLLVERAGSQRFVAVPIGQG